MPGTSRNFVSKKTMVVAKKLVERGLLDKSHFDSVEKTRLSTKTKSAVKHRGLVNQVNAYKNCSYDKDATFINNKIIHYWDRPGASKQGFKVLRAKMEKKQERIESRNQERKYRKKNPAKPSNKRKVQRKKRPHYNDAQIRPEIRQRLLFERMNDY